MNVLYAGLIVWILTCILVTSEITRPIRDWFEVRRDNADVAWVSHDFTQDSKEDRRLQLRYLIWEKAIYLVNCQLCAGTWVGLALGFIIPGPFAAVLNGLLYKAVAHGILCVQNTFERYS